MLIFTFQTPDQNYTRKNWGRRLKKDSKRRNKSWKNALNTTLLYKQMPPRHKWMGHLYSQHLTAHVLKKTHLIYKTHDNTQCVWPGKVQERSVLNMGNYPKSHKKPGKSINPWKLCSFTALLHLTFKNILQGCRWNPHLFLQLWSLLTNMKGMTTVEGVRHMLLQCFVTSFPISTPALFSLLSSLIARSSSTAAWRLCCPVSQSSAIWSPSVKRFTISKLQKGASICVTGGL